MMFIDLCSKIEIDRYLYAGSVVLIVQIVSPQAATGGEVRVHVQLLRGVICARNVHRTPREFGHNRQDE